MADKQISQLPEASGVTITDLFVLEQSGSAKKLTGSTLQAWLISMADGHGGISTIAKTGTAGLVDTYTITYADNSTSTFTVTNGSNGANGADGVNGATFTPSVDASGDISWTNDGGLPNPTTVNIKGTAGTNGTSSYAYIKWSHNQPTSDADMGDIPDDWMGIYVGASSTAPTAYTSYAWYNIKGAKGDDGDPITAVTRTGGDGSPGTDDTYTCYVNATAVGTIIVHNGSDGVGTVNSINEIGVEAGTNNITLTASDVGAPKIPLHLSVASFSSLPKTISDPSITSTMRVIECTFGTPVSITSNISWTTSDGSLVLSGSMSGSTTAEIDLIETT